MNNEFESTSKYAVVAHLKGLSRNYSGGIFSWLPSVIMKIFKKGSPRPDRRSNRRYRLKSSAIK
jgi:hypothetical protein